MGGVRGGGGVDFWSVEPGGRTVDGFGGAWVGGLRWGWVGGGVEGAACRGCGASEMGIVELMDGFEVRAVSRTARRAASLVFAATAAVSLHAIAPVAQAQMGDRLRGQLGLEEPEADASPIELLNDFTYYVNIDQLGLAEGNAQALLDSDLTPAEFVRLVESEVGMEERFERAYRRALRFPQLEDDAAELYSFYERGQRDIARNLERIRQNIELLNGTARQRLVGRQRLVEASQYAIPTLLDTLLNAEDPVLEAEVRDVLAEIGSNAVLPLSEALMNVEPTAQAELAFLLGRIGSPTALPWLYQLESETGDRDVREAARSAIGSIDRSFDSQVAASGLFRDLSRVALGESGSLTAFPDEEYQLLFEYDPRIGLVMREILSEVYHEALAMEFAENALSLRPSDVESVAVWVKSNFKRENEQPADYENPAYPPERRDAEYYAVSAGVRPLQIALDTSLRENRTVLARRTIEALDQVAGSDAMMRAEMMESPALLEALSYPDRRVQYEAALAIAKSQPRESFSEAERVVPVLASILRDAGERYAMVISGDQERQAEIREALDEAGYTVLAPAASLDAARQSMIEAPGVDVIVSDVNGDAGAELIREVRNMPRLRATPVLAAMPFNDVSRFRQQFAGDPLTMLTRDGATMDQLLSGIDDLVRRNVGEPMGQGEAIQYRVRSLNALYDLAVSNNDVLDVDLSSRALLAGLERNTGELGVRVAEILSYVDQARAQVAIADAALDASGSERVRLLRVTAASAKRYGNMLEPRQVDRIVEFAETGSDSEATAAAALMGALNLPNDRIVPLILGE